uniref:HAT C-terminal dimerisation domain-containing protein n=1 Tax=Nothobranchius furzeri TaxID=105023 RepID=A0A1A8B1S9_NOTFU
MLTERGLNLKDVVSVTTDGAPSMIGREKGAVKPDSCLNKGTFALPRCCSVESPLYSYWPDPVALEDQLQRFMKNPFLVKDVIAFSQEAARIYKWVEISSLQMERVDLQADVLLKGKCEASDHTSFWLQAVPKTTFPGLFKVVEHTLTMFGSTYSCESAFSTVNMTKNKLRSRLTNEHLHACLRMAVTPFHPKFQTLAANANFSH